MSHPRPGGRRRGLPVLSPLIVLAALAAGTAFAAARFDERSAKPAAEHAPAPGTAPTQSQPVTDPEAADHPPGTLFDSFDYAGADDPQLRAHGWEVRSEGGGPGIKDTWSPSGVSFPATSSAQGGKALQLQLTTDGTKAGTRQAQLSGSPDVFTTGTVAARVYFSDAPVSGRNGDHINQTAYLISPPGSDPAKYTELDFEYMPNGGWGAPGPRLDTTSWRSATDGDRVTSARKTSFKGWHIVMITAMDGTVTYSVDGEVLFRSSGREFPREATGVQFSTWLVDLPFTGSRTWNMQVNWVYAKAGQTVSLKDVQSAVRGFYTDGTDFVDTMPRP